MFGHNDRLGWSLTVNYPDVVDLYEIDVEERDGQFVYRFGDEYRPIEKWTTTIRVRQPDVSFVEQERLFHKTHHGPILAKRGEKFIAVRIANIESGGLLTQWYRMGKARNLDEFKEAIAGCMARREDIPSTSAARGRPVVTPGAVISAKAALYTAMRAEGVSNSALARTLGCAEGEVRRMLDPRHATKIGRLEEGLAALGKRLVVEVATV